MAQRLVAQQVDDGARDGLCVAEWHQFAAFLGQQFCRVPVGRGHNRVTGAERIGQRARGYLCFSKVGRKVDVRRADKPHQFLQFDEAIEECNVLLHSKVLGHPLKAQSVKLTLMAQKIGVRLAHHDENRVRKFSDDARQRAQGVLDALVWRKEPEREQYLFARHAELIFKIIRVSKRHVGDAVRNEVYLVCRRLIDIEQNLPALFSHNHQPRGKPDQFAHHAPLIRVRLAQNCVKRGYDRHSQLVQQCQQVTARQPAVYAKLVFHAEDIHICNVEEIRRAQVGRQILLRNLESHLRRILIAALDVIDRNDQALRGRKLKRHRSAQVCCERCNAALPREIIAEERNFADVG